MEMVWTPRRQGDAGELSAINWLFYPGARVYVPLFTDPDCDLVADFGDRVDRVQVKTSTAEYEVEPGEPLQARPPPSSQPSA